MKSTYATKTHYEDGKYYGRVLLQCGLDYYIGPFKCRTSARRAVLRILKIGNATAEKENHNEH